MDNLWKLIFVLCFLADVKKNSQTRHSFWIYGLSLFLFNFRIYVYIIELSCLTYNEMHKVPRDYLLGWGIFVRELSVSYATMWHVMLQFTFQHKISFLERDAEESSTLPSSSNVNHFLLLREVFFLTGNIFFHSVYVHVLIFIF